MGRAMRSLIAVGATCAVLVGGAWLAGAALTERALRDWFEDRAADGWVAAYADVDTGGFPGRFTTEITEIRLADPATGWAWTAPRFTLRQRPWRPGRIEAIWPRRQTLASPFERLEIEAEALAAALDARPSADLALDGARLEARALTLRGDPGGAASLERATWTILRREEGAATYDVAFAAEGVSPPAGLVAALDPSGDLPATLETVRYAAAMSFDRPWDMSALEVARPRITRIALEELRAGWGPLSLRAAGGVDVGPDGRATGRVALRAENWRDMLELAARAGALPDALRATLETALGLVAALSGRPEDIDATLRLEDGTMYLGPFPLGAAPRLILR